MIRLRRMAALLLAASLFAPAARAATRIEGDYQLMMELRKTGRTYPWDWDSNSYDTYDNASFRIFSQPRQGVEAFVKFEGDWNPSDNSGTRNVPRTRRRMLVLKFSSTIPTVTDIPSAPTIERAVSRICRTGCVRYCSEAVTKSHARVSSVASIPCDFRAAKISPKRACRGLSGEVPSTNC